MPHLPVDGNEYFSGPFRIKPSPGPFAVGNKTKKSSLSFSSLRNSRRTRTGIFANKLCVPVKINPKRNTRLKSGCLDFVWRPQTTWRSPFVLSASHVFLLDEAVMAVGERSGSKRANLRGYLIASPPLCASGGSISARVWLPQTGGGAPPREACT